MGEWWRKTMDLGFDSDCSMTIGVETLEVVPVGDSMKVYLGREEWTIDCSKEGYFAVRDLVQALKGLENAAS